MRYFLVCYDIEDDKRRNKVARCLLGWGRRVQYSVFEVACVHEKDLKEMCEQLEKLREFDDSIRVYRFSEDTRRKSGELNGKPMRHCPAIVIL